MAICPSSSVIRDCGRYRKWPKCSDGGDRPLFVARGGVVSDMTTSLTLALATILAIGAVAWFGSRRQAVAFAIVAAAILPATFLPLGHATPFHPDCPCTVLGARIDPEKAIWVLLDGAADGGGEPRFHKLPYSQMAANQLQAALDGAAESQGTVKMQLGEDGSPGFAEEAPPPEPDKAAEQSAILGG